MTKIYQGLRLRMKLSSDAVPGPPFQTAPILKIGAVFFFDRTGANVVSSTGSHGPTRGRLGISFAITARAL
jgi:hypothetical protein